MIEPAPLQQINRTQVLFEGRRWIYFGGCDYFRLSSDPRVHQAARAALSRFGLNVAASRLTTGNHKLYAQLESALVRFFGAESATLVSTGYATNLVAAQALSGTVSAAFLDARAHPSLTDAAKFLGCPVRTFAHRDPTDLRKKLTRLREKSRVLVLTDGLFAHDGSCAPLPDYLQLLPPSSRLLLDDAHGAGVLGRSGRGTPEHYGLSDARVIQTLTLSKAFGAYGGAILADNALGAKSRATGLFAGSTPLPLPLAAAALRSLNLLRQNPQWRRHLSEKAAHFRETLTRHGVETAPSPGPIIPIIPSSPQQAKKLAGSLRRHRVFPPFIRYPGGPPGGYFRFAISSEHSKTEMDALAAAIIEGVA
jgi:8-amino-7-oxononanoate synthase